MRSIIQGAAALALAALFGQTATAQDYPAPVPLADGAQAKIESIVKAEGPLRIAYMPPATEFAYYIAIGEGIKSVAAKKGVEVFMLAPQSGADINGQMGMIQDVLTQDVDAIIFGTHDEGAAAPLLKQAIDKGIAVVMINSDIPNFPTPIDGVIGYAQRKGTHKIADWATSKVGDAQVKVGIIEGQPGYHSTERVGGFKDGIDGKANLEIVSSIDGKWNVEGGNTAAMDMLQAHPEIGLIFAANDNMAIGASYAAKALGRTDLLILGNDGDTAGLEAIAENTVSATVNTVPFVMGQVALNVTLDALDHKFPGGWVEIPTEIVDKDTVVPVLQAPEKLYPQPSKKY
ncbi:sugar ABC transporter substrate-binding protein [Mesorhizobium sp. DCY119]|uniref:sugar ABC transporter substrate-binding protein n=1 Tax=Mesorhizobium sp. DCY119 TaxID=2108445 RepID=UPI000E6BCD5F|nr:sugar ABC transporter substrate-binding protein [Mesorhizobium sp. DCY119]RJG46176.1 sugar ABC transporter substrate-binding protein [Mesorhizobium sp. DCY119]